MVRAEQHSEGISPWQTGLSNWHLCEGWLSHVPNKEVKWCRSIVWIFCMLRVAMRILWTRRLRTRAMSQYGSFLTRHGNPLKLWVGQWLWCRSCLYHRDSRVWASLDQPQAEPRPEEDPRAKAFQKSVVASSSPTLTFCPYPILVSSIRLPGASHPSPSQPSFRSACFMSSVPLFLSPCPRVGSPSDA